MKRVDDDLGSTVDSEDNLPRMIMIEQAIDAAYEIEENVSRSYAFCDCIMAITELARETNNEGALRKINSLMDEVKNKGARVRALTYYAVALAHFERANEAEELLIEALNRAADIKDEFELRDAFLEVATAAGDIAFLLDKPELIKLAQSLSEHFTKAQKSYLKGYLSNIVHPDKSLALIREATQIAESIDDPIARSKTFLDLANLLSNFNKEFEE